MKHSPKVTWNDTLSSAHYSEALWNGVGRYASAVLGLPPVLHGLLQVICQ